MALKNNHVKEAVEAIKVIAKREGIEPNEVKRGQVIAELSEWQVRRVGSFGNLLNANFPTIGKDLSGLRETKENSSYIKSLEDAIGKRELFDKLLLETIEKKIKPLPKPKYVSKLKKHNKTNRELTCMLNDTHYGLIIDSEAIDNVNSFSWTEACRRTAMFTREVIGYKKDKRNETSKLNLVLNGDLINGIIHGLTSRTMDLWIHQMNGATNILTHTIDALSKEFAHVQVHGITGNHEELPHKREGGHRSTQEHYDSFSNSIFYALSIAFRNYPNISFNIPKTPYVFFNLPSGRAMAAHGHNVFSKSLGNPGKTINVKLLSDEIRTFNVGEKLKGKEPVKLLLLGHCHSYAHFITNDGTEVYIAPSLSGVDEFAHQLTINTNFIAQCIFESTKDFILGDSRLIRLQHADNDKSLDKIIPIYNKELKWQK